MKKLIAVILVIIMLTLTGCQWYKINFTHAWEAVSLAADFCLALEGDVELAKKYLHTESNPSKENLQSFLEEIEQENNICFSDGVALRSNRGFSFDLGPQGSSICTYEFSLEIVVGIRPIHLTFYVRKDDNGYSIIYIEQGEWVAES